MNPIIFETQFNESGTRVYYMRLGRLYRFRTENGDLEYVSTTSVCIDQEIVYFSLHESLGILFVTPKPTPSIGSQRMRFGSLPSTIVRFDLRSKEMIDSRSFGNKDLRNIRMNRNYISLVFRDHIKIYHAFNFKESLQKFDTADNPEGVVSLAQKRDIFAFPTPGPPGGITILKLGGPYLRKQEWARLIRTQEKDRWLKASLSRNGNYLAVVSTRGTPVRVIEIRNQNQIYEFKIKNPQKRILDLEFSFNNKYLAVLCPTSLFIFRITKLLEPKRASSPVVSNEKNKDEEENEGEEEKREGEEEEEEEEIIITEEKKQKKKEVVPAAIKKKPRRTSSTSMFFSLFGGGQKKSLVGKYNFKTGEYPASVRFSKNDDSVVMIASKRGSWIEMKFEYDMTTREKRRLRYPTDGPVRVSERTIEDSMCGEKIYLSNLGIIAKEKSDENEFVFQCIARRDTPDPAPQIKPTEVIVNQNTGQTVKWLSNVIRVRIGSLEGKTTDYSNPSSLNKTGEDEKMMIKNNDQNGWGSDEDSSSSSSSSSSTVNSSSEERSDDSEESEGEENNEEEDDDILGIQRGVGMNKKKKKRKKKIYLFVNGELQDDNEELYRLFQKYRTIQHPSSSDNNNNNNSSFSNGGRNSLKNEIDIGDDEDTSGGNISPKSEEGGEVPFSVLSTSPSSEDGDHDDGFGKIADLPENVVAMKKNRIVRIYYSYVHQPTSFVHISKPQKMPISLSRHSSNLIDSEKGYIFGGVNLSRGKFRLSSHLYSVEFMEGKVIDFSKVHLGLYGTTAPVRYSHTSFYDAEERKLYIFGGSDDRVFSGDVFVFSLSKKKWERVDCKGTVPLPRIDSQIVFRRRCRKAILWGGFVGSLRRGEYCNELYELDLEHMRWNKFFRLSNDLIPVGRSKHFLKLYSDESMMLLNGGFHDFQPCYDTWSYDFANHHWRRLSIMAPFSNPLVSTIFRNFMVTVSEDLNKVHIFNIQDRCWKRIYVIKEDEENNKRNKKKKKKKKKSYHQKQQKLLQSSISMASSLSNSRNIIYIFGGETKERKSLESYYIIDFSHYNFD